ncbi:hypothetical protein IAG25_35105 [Caballeronia sp. EK]|uniref:hypothetical protein n=1 Tax=Caballeronia sp. EK TaxID=2767469 RepID=UPI001655DDC6|nr:hypothetical protein [Caballeronia sp. EK]MBC8642038.1 hypothetical protein [Caballeronia sp. EK]
MVVDFVKGSGPRILVERKGKEEMRVSKRLNAAPPPPELGADAALAAGYTCWANSAGGGTALHVVKLAKAEYDGNISPDASSGIAEASNVFAFAEAVVTWAMFVKTDRSGHKVKASLDELERAPSGPDEFGRDYIPAELDKVRQDWDDFKNRRGSAILTLLRDGVVQTMKAMISTVVVASVWAGEYGIEVLGKVLEGIGAVAGAVLSLLCGALHAVVGVLDFFRFSKEETASKKIAAKIASCFDKNRRIDLMRMVDGGNDERHVEGLRSMGAAGNELEHIKDIYESFSKLAESNLTSVSNEKNKWKWFSVARFGYGMAAITVGGLILGGVGGLVLPLVGAALGLGWLSFAAYKFIAALIAKRKGGELHSAEWLLIKEVGDKSLNDAEHRLLKEERFQKSTSVAAAILVEHLSGGKIESRKREQAGLAESRQAQEVGHGGSGGLRMRRKIAVRFLIHLGMNRRQIRGIKLAIAEGREALAFRQLEGVMSGKYRRAMS